MRALDGLYPFCPEVRLFHDRDKLASWCMRRYGCPPDMSDEADAQTTYWDGTAIVLIDPREECDPVWEDALLIHEAYHVVCNHLKYIGESSAGEEVVAYMMQCVSGALMSAHHRWKEKHASNGERPLG